MFKRVLLVGLALLAVGGVLVIEFPNAAWNHAASWMVWVLSIALVVSTLGLCVLVAIRFVSRLMTPAAPLLAIEAQQLTTGSQWSRRVVLALVSIVSVGTLVVLLLVFVEHEIKSSPVYQASIAKARVSPGVLERLGNPMNAGWFVSGQLSESTNGGGVATLTIPLKGPRGNGKLRVQAGRQAGTWRFSVLQFAPDGHNPIDLLSEQPK